MLTTTLNIILMINREKKLKIKSGFISDTKTAFREIGGFFVGNWQQPTHFI